jgi:hypothetical protein
LLRRTIRSVGSPLQSRATGESVAALSLNEDAGARPQIAAGFAA